MRRHAADLAVLALAQRQLDPRRRNLRAITNRRIARPEIRGLFDEPRAGRLRHEVAEVDSCAQRRQRILGRRALDLRPVDLRKLELRARDARLQGAVVRQQQQPFAVRVEPAGGIYRRNLDEIGERLLAGLRRELAGHAEGFVEGDQHVMDGDEALSCRCRLSAMIRTNMKHDVGGQFRLSGRRRLCVVAATAIAGADWCKPCAARSRCRNSASP